MEEVYSLGKEAIDVLHTPFEPYGFLAAIAVAGGVGLVYSFDGHIRNDLEANKSSALDTATDIGNIVGNPLVHLGVAGVVYGGGTLASSKKWQETGLMLGEAALLADATSLVLKESIGRARPFLNAGKKDFKPFEFESDYDSMPSMHTASSFAMASVMSATSENYLVKSFYYMAATFVGFSRMYRDEHWASDVVLGAAIGELCGRVALRYHSQGKSNSVALVPGISDNTVSLVLATRW